MTETRCPAWTEVTPRCRPPAPRRRTRGRGSAAARDRLSGCGLGGDHDRAHRVLVEVGAADAAPAAAAAAPRPAPGRSGDATSSTRMSWSPWNTAALMRSGPSGRGWPGVGTWSGSRVPARGRRGPCPRAAGGQPLQLLGQVLERVAPSRAARRRGWSSARMSSAGARSSAQTCASVVRDRDLPHHQRVDVDLLLAGREAHLEDGPARCGPGRSRGRAGRVRRWPR